MWRFALTASVASGELSLRVFENKTEGDGSDRRTALRASENKTRETEVTGGLH